MTPTDKPFDSANEPENPQNNQPLSSPSNDAAALQAIEALETESNELDGTTPEEVKPTPTSSAPAPATVISDSLKDEPTAPSSTEYQPFATKRNTSKKPLIIVVIVIIVIGLGFGGYFGWQYLQSQNDTPIPVQNVPDEELSGQDVNNTTEASITDEVTEIETQLDTIVDTEYDDTTLSDESLYN